MQLTPAAEFSVPLATTAAIFYPLTGYYLDHKVEIRAISQKKWTALLAAAFAAIGISCLCLYMSGTTDENCLSLFDYVLAMEVFLFVKYMTTVRFPALSSGRTAKTVCFLGSLTLGIYLLDHYFKLIMYNGYERLAERFMPSLFASFGWCVISMLLGGSVTVILKKVPLVKRIL